MEGSRNRILGTEGEELAVRYLTDRGFSIIERNYRAGRAGEIDIIAERGDLVIFAEVKNRTTERFGGALYSIGAKKRGHIRAAARAFLAARPGYNRRGRTFRYDLLAVGGGSVEWVEDMFR